MAWNRPKSGEAESLPLQGKSGRSSSSKRRGRRFSVRGAIAGAIVVIGAGIAVWWIFGNGPAPVREDADGTVSGRIREVKPAVAKPGMAKAEKDAKADQPTGQQVAAADVKDAKPREKLISSTTNELGYILERVIQPNGRPLLRVREVPSAWEYPTDELIAMSIFDNDDTPMPPLPPTDGIREDKMFLESVKKPIRINPDDSPEVKARKRIVESVREEIAARMEKGENFMDILEDNRALVNENIDIRGKALRELSEIEQTGSREDAEVYRDAMNQQFDNLGIKHIELTNEGEE